MRVFLLLLLSTSCIFCQKLENNNFLILESESPQYYYVLTEDGYYISESSEKFRFKQYTKPIPKSLNVGLNTLLPVMHKDKSYLLYPGGGLLYLFSDGAITRIDRSFPHRNQYGGYFFSYNDNLYLIGGYGYWQTKSIITKFNFNSGDWEILNSYGQSPEGIDQGTFLLKNNKLYVFDFLTRQSNNQKEFRNDNLYVLDLETFIWNKLGVINTLLKTNGQLKGYKRFFDYNKNLLFSYADKPEFYIADLEKNRLKKYKDDVLFYKSGGHSIVKKNSLISAIQNSLTGDVTIESFNLKPIIDLDETEGVYLYRDDKGFFEYLYFAFSFLAILLITLSVYYKRVAQTYLLDNNTISISGYSQDINKMERKILEMFSKKRSLSNSELMNLFIEKDKTKDFAVKRKNKAILALNDKLVSVFRTEFVHKQKSKSDSRQLTYFLNKKVRVVVDKTMN